MKNTFLKPVFDTLRYWYNSLLVGILFIIVGVFAFVSPGIPFLSLAILFSLSLLFSGISEVIFSFKLRKVHRHAKKNKARIERKVPEDKARNDRANQRVFF